MANVTLTHNKRNEFLLHIEMLGMRIKSAQFNRMPVTPMHLYETCLPPHVREAMDVLIADGGNQRDYLNEGSYVRVKFPELNVWMSVRLPEYVPIYRTYIQYSDKNSDKNWDAAFDIPESWASYDEFKEFFIRAAKVELAYKHVMSEMRRTTKSCRTFGQLRRVWPGIEDLFPPEYRAKLGPTIARYGPDGLKPPEHRQFILDWLAKGLMLEDTINKYNIEIYSK